MRLLAVRRRVAVADRSGTTAGADTGLLRDAECAGLRVFFFLALCTANVHGDNMHSSTSTVIQRIISLSSLRGPGECVAAYIECHSLPGQNRYY